MVRRAIPMEQHPPPQQLHPLMNTLKVEKGDTITFMAPKEERSANEEKEDEDEAEEASTRKAILDPRMPAPPPPLEKTKIGNAFSARSTPTRRKIATK